MRILKRPMFKKGGSANEGIMDGLVDRNQYAGGGTIGGGTIQGTPMGYRTGFQNPLADAAKAALASGNVRGGSGNISGTASKSLESSIASKFRNLGRWARQPNTGITGWLLRNFPKTFRAGAYGAPVYGALKGSGAQLELIQEAADKGLLDEYGESVEFADGRILPSSEFAEKVRPSEYTVKSGIYDKGPVTGVDEPPGGTQLPFYKKPETEDTGGLDDIKIKETIADKRSRLNKRAKEFLDILSPEAQKRALIDSAAAASEALGQSTGDTKQDIANAITAAAKASGGTRDIVDKARLLAIQEDIQKGLKVDKVSETDKEWSKWVIANPMKEGESMPDYYSRILTKMSTGKIPVETKLDHIRIYTAAGGTKEDGLIDWAKKTYGTHKDFGGIIDKENMPTPVEGKKYYDPEADDWKNHKGEPTTAPGE